MPYASIDARLRSSTAWLMLRLARVQPGDVVLDPMCGIGTVPLEAAATTLGCPPEGPRPCSRDAGFAVVNVTEDDLRLAAAQLLDPSFY